MKINWTVRFKNPVFWVQILVAIILPICLVSLFLGGAAIPFKIALPYLLGSVGGGFAAGIWGKKIPTVWLHRILGAFVLWGGIRYLC